MSKLIEIIQEGLMSERKKLYYVRAIFIYGSFARNDYDINSDMDILVISEYGNNRIENRVKQIISKYTDDIMLDISVYSGKRFETLLEYGSLFLHHIRQEGIIVYGKGKNAKKEYLFGKLKEFKGVSEDLLLYSRMLEKSRCSIRENGVNFFDLNNLCILARNTMIVTCYREGNPKYGKWDAYETCACGNTSFCLSRDVYKELLSIRSYYNRMKPKMRLPKEETCNKYLSEVANLINWALERAGIRNSLDRLFYLFYDSAGRNFYTSYEIFTDFERDIYLYFSRYMKMKYGASVDSISDCFIVSMKEKYPDDRLVNCTYKLMYEIKEIKKKSSNYSIDTPDIYSEIHVKENNIFSLIYEIGERHPKIKEILVKIMRSIKGKDLNREKNVVELLEEFREYVSHNIQ